MFDFFDKFNKWYKKLPAAIAGETYVHVAALKSLAAEYSLEIVAAQRPVADSLEHGSITRVNLERAIEIIRSELAVYSPDMIKRSQLKRIAICSELKVGETHAAGAMRAETGTMFFAINDISQQNIVYNRRAFHHELFHCIDYYDDVHRYYDPSWALLNEAGFLYSFEKHSKMQNVQTSRMGFISNYSMAAVHEDKAELYAYLVMHSSRLHEIAEIDAVLAKKIEKLKELLFKFSQHYNQTFWSVRHVGSVPLIQEQLISVTLNIWREQIGGSFVWLLARKDCASKPLLFYSQESLAACLKNLDLIGFDEAQAIKNGHREVEFNAKVLSSKINQAGLYEVFGMLPRPN